MDRKAQDETNGCAIRDDQGRHEADLGPTKSWRDFVGCDCRPRDNRQAIRGPCETAQRFRGVV